MKYRSLSIVIPVYNEEKFITTALKQVLQADIGSLSKEIVIVDDGSQDKTVNNIKKELKKLKAEVSKTKDNKKTVYKMDSAIIQLIEKAKNEGKGAALKLGFIQTTGDIVLVQDADLEYVPQEYSLLIEPFLQHEAEVVYGSRFITNRPHRVLYFWHYAANIFLTTLSNIFTNLNLTDMETGYKVFNGNLIRKLAPKLQCKRFGFEPEITARIAKLKNLKLYEVGISYYGRTYGEGKKIGWKDGIRAIWEVIKYNVFVRS